VAVVEPSQWPSCCLAVSARTGQTLGALMFGGSLAIPRVPRAPSRRRHMRRWLGRVANDTKTSHGAKAARLLRALVVLVLSGRGEHVHGEIMSGGRFRVTRSFVSAVGCLLSGLCSAHMHTQDCFERPHQTWYCTQPEPSNRINAHNWATG
jgi:hypothetical protein